MKQNRKKKKPPLLSPVTVLVWSVIVANSLAFFSSVDVVTNRFVAVTLTVDLLEPQFDRLSYQERMSMVPNKTLPKDPMVRNVDETDAFVFLKITVPVAYVTGIEEDGTKGTKQRQELFYLKTTSDPTVLLTEFNTAPADSSDREYWVRLPDEETGTDYADDTRTYIFGYSLYLRQGEQTETLFDYVQLKNIPQYELDDAASLHVKVEAFGIQKNYLGGMDTGVDNEKRCMTAEELTRIYRYIKSDEE